MNFLGVSAPAEGHGINVQRIAHMVERARPRAEHKHLASAGNRSGCAFTSSGWIFESQGTGLPLSDWSVSCSVPE